MSTKHQKINLSVGECVYVCVCVTAHNAAVDHSFPELK